MLKRGERICPCCGKPLEHMGKVLGDKYHEFYLGERHTVASEYKERFERDKIWGSGINMYCSECGVRIKLLDDPFLVLETASFLIVTAFFIASVIAALMGTNIIPTVLPIAVAA